MIQVRRNLDDRGVAPDTETTEVDSSGRLANRPPDATLDPVDVMFLGQEDRIRVLVDERGAALDQRDALLHQVRELETQRAVLERHLTRVVNSESYWRVSYFDEEAAIRRVSYLAAALFCALVIAEGGRVMAWIWRLVHA